MIAGKLISTSPHKSGDDSVAVEVRLVGEFRGT